MNCFEKFGVNDFKSIDFTSSDLIQKKNMKIFIVIFAMIRIQREIIKIETMKLKIIN